MLMAWEAGTSQEKWAVGKPRHGPSSPVAWVINRHQSGPCFGNPHGRKKAIYAVPSMPSSSTSNAATGGLSGINGTATGPQREVALDRALA